MPSYRLFEKYKRACLAPTSTCGKRKQPTFCAPELVTLVVALHMCYRALTLNLTQVVVVG